MILFALILITLIPILSNNLNAEDLKSYEIFEKDGSETDFEDMVEAAMEADIIFFGEQHNNPICHWLQLKLTQELFNEKKSNLILGAEMFEADDQFKIDEYFAGYVNTKSFEKESRLWNNYQTDYKPLLEFARENKLRFVATNIPRRYASAVSREGLTILDSLPEESKKYIPELPIEVDMELPGYKKMAQMMGGGSHGIKFLPEAQAVKDATMAHFILENFTKGKTFIHYNGAYHSDDFEGIVWFIRQHNPEIRIMTISNSQQDEIEELKEEEIGKADFIIITPSDMTKTY